MYKKGAGNDKQGKDAGNRTLWPYRNFSQAIMIESIANCCCHSCLKIIKEDKLNSDYFILDIKILNGSVSPTLALPCLFIQSSLYTATFQRLT